MPNAVGVEVDCSVVYQAVYGVGAFRNFKHSAPNVENSRASLAVHITRMLLGARYLHHVLLGVPLDQLSQLPANFFLRQPQVDFLEDQRLMAVYPEAMVRCGQGLAIGPTGHFCRVFFPAGNMEAVDYLIERRPVQVVQPDGTIDAQYNKILVNRVQEQGCLLTHRQCYFRKEENGTATFLFRRQSCKPGVVVLVDSQLRVMAGRGPELTRIYRCTTVRTTRNYQISVQRADPQWQQSILPVQCGQSIFGSIVPWWGELFQYHQLDMTFVNSFPDVAENGDVNCEFTELDIPCPVPVPASVLGKIMPKVMGLKFEEGPAEESVMFNTVCQKCASEFEKLGVNPQHIAAASSAVYALAAYNSAVAKEEAQDAVVAALNKKRAEFRPSKNPKPPSTKK